MKDENRCCLIMQDLMKLPFTKDNLFVAPEIVETIKKVTHFYLRVIISGTKMNLLII